MRWGRNRIDEGVKGRRRLIPFVVLRLDLLAEFADAVAALFGLQFALIVHVRVPLPVQLALKPALRRLGLIARPPLTTPAWHTMKRPALLPASHSPKI
jgi:hypothetical protein